MKKKQSPNLKRIVSGLLSLTMITSVSAVLPANADAASKQEAYPYAVFAADELGGITLNLDGLTVNGNACTNGVYSTTAKYANINGTITANEALVVDEVVTDDESTTDAQDISNPFDVSRDMIYIHNKLMTSWFNNGRNFENDYTLSEMNINLNSPVYVTGKMSYKGNLALNTAIGAVSDVTLSDGNLNGNNAVIYSKFGDIKITESQASMNGLIYAPFGTVTIDCDNFNLNGLVIAQNVVINSGNANINYSNTWAEFVGIETEKLSWTFDDWKYLADTDKDGLPNLIEKEIGTKPYDADTDGDLLPDGYEIFTLFTNPKKADTDGNGVSDYDEDFDNDGLSNGREYEIGTLPSDSDTDGDNLKDGDEVNTYFTNPLEVDTDKDGLNDDDEIYFGTDPNDPDTDDNGILDGAEKRSQTFTHKVKNEDCAVTEVIVSMEGTGNLQKTTTVDSIMNRDMLCTDVVGLVGEPFSIETTSKFDKATLTFKIDQSKLGDTNFDDLLFLWYDEDDYKFVELDTIFDEANSTVSIETTHFSKYMVVDKYLWFEAWSMQFNYNPGREHVDGDYLVYDKNYTVLTIDCSGSMSSNDPIGIRSNINSAYDAQFTRTCGRISASENFISLMMGEDQTSIVLFDNYAFDTMAMTDDTLQLRLGLQKVCNRNGTEFLPAIQSSMDMFTEEQLNDTNANNRIILLSDGIDFYPTETKRYLNNLYNYHNPDKRNRVKIYTIALGSGADTAFLEEIANITHGEAYKAYTASELVDIYKEIGIGGDFDTTDTDGDGLYDAVESAGIRIQNGKIIYTNPTTKHTDTDGLEDGEEIDPTPKHSNKKVYDIFGNVRAVKGYYFVMKSDPSKNDTDGDLDKDNIDPHPLRYQLNDCFIDKIKDLEEYADEYNGNAVDWLMKYSIDKEYWLTLMFIRSFADGTNGTSNYVGGNWPVVANEIDWGFVNYVYNNDYDLYMYFNNTTEIYANPDGEIVDLRHLAATATVYIYKTDLLDAQYFDYLEYHDYQAWYHVINNACTLGKNIVTLGKNAFKVASTEMFEYNFDNLGGWAGDLQTLMNDTYDQVMGSEDYDTFYDAFYNSIGTNSFSMDDMYADTDAYNVYIQLLDGSNFSLAEAFDDYYTDGYLKRYSSFTNNWSEDEISDLTYTYTKNKFANLYQWPLFDHDFSTSQSKAARDAFVKFLMEKISNE